MSGFEDLGIELGGEYQENDNSMEFPSLRVRIGDLSDGDIFTGEPVLTKIREKSQKYQEEYPGTKKYYADLYLMDYGEDQYLQIQINLNTDDDIQKNIYPSSKLFPLVQGVLNYLYPDEPSLDGSRILEKMKFSSLRKMVEDIDEMTVQIELMQGINGGNPYNSYKVIKNE